MGKIGDAFLQAGSQLADTKIKYDYYSAKKENDAAKLAQDQQKMKDQELYAQTVRQDFGDAAYYAAKAGKSISPWTKSAGRRRTDRDGSFNPVKSLEKTGLTIDSSLANAVMKALEARANGQMDDEKYQQTIKTLEKAHQKAANKIKDFTAQNDMIVTLGSIASKFAQQPEKMEKIAAAVKAKLANVAFDNLEDDEADAIALADLDEFNQKVMATSIKDELDDNFLKSIYDPKISIDDVVASPKFRSASKDAKAVYQQAILHKKLAEDFGGVKESAKAIKDMRKGPWKKKTK